MPGLTSGPTSAADITPPHGSSPPLVGVPSRSESPAVTEGDASSPFILGQAGTQDNTHTRIGSTDLDLDNFLKPNKA